MISDEDAIQMLALSATCESLAIGSVPSRIVSGWPQVILAGFAKGTGRTHERPIELDVRPPRRPAAIRASFSVVSILAGLRPSPPRHVEGVGSLWLVEQTR